MALTGALDLSGLSLTSLNQPFNIAGVQKPVTVCSLLLTPGAKGLEDLDLSQNQLKNIHLPCSLPALRKLNLLGNPILSLTKTLENLSRTACNIEELQIQIDSSE
jgi:Leucine-rich repeat (LRR) protein